METFLISILAMAALFWWFNYRMDRKFTEIKDDLKEMRTDLKELRTSVNRMEGAFISKDCCMLKNDQQQKKVE